MSKGNKRSEHQQSFLFAVHGSVVKPEVMAQRRAELERARREKLADRIADEVSKRPIARTHKPSDVKS